MVTETFVVITEADILASGGTAVGDTFARVGASFTYDSSAMPWWTIVVEDEGDDQTNLSSDTQQNTNSDGGPNPDNEGTDGETGTIYDPLGNAFGTKGGRVASDRWGVLQGSDGSTVIIYEIENYDDLDLYGFSAPLVDGVTYTTVRETDRDVHIPYDQLICFHHGTRLLTPRGEVRVEDLRLGDLVISADRGAVPVRWIGRGRNGRPVRIRAGALGNRCDLLVSPQHRLLLQHVVDGEAHDILVAARLLAEEGDARFSHADDISAPRYVNLMFDRHEIVFADGAAAESFFPGPMAVHGCSMLERRALFARYPRLAGIASFDQAQEVYGPAARPVMGRAALRKALAQGEIRYPQGSDQAQGDMHAAP